MNYSEWLQFGTYNAEYFITQLESAINFMRDNTSGFNLAKNSSYQIQRKYIKSSIEIPSLKLASLQQSPSFQHNPTSKLSSHNFKSARSYANQKKTSIDKVLTTSLTLSTKLLDQIFSPLSKSPTKSPQKAPFITQQSSRNVKRTISKQSKNTYADMDKLVGKQDKYSQIIDRLQRKKKLISELKQLAYVPKFPQGSPISMNKLPKVQDFTNKQSLQETLQTDSQSSSFRDVSFTQASKLRFSAKDMPYSPNQQAFNITERQMLNVKSNFKSTEKMVPKDSFNDFTVDSFKKIKNSYYTPRELKNPLRLGETPKKTINSYYKINFNDNKSATVFNQNKSTAASSNKNSPESTFIMSQQCGMRQIFSGKPRQPKTDFNRQGDVRLLVGARRSKQLSSYFQPEKPSINDFILGKKLGQGKYGTVYLGIHKLTHSVFAIKKISKATASSNQMIDQLKQQIKIQLYCDHRNILKLYGCFSDSNYVYLILQYMQEGQLFGLLTKQGTLSVSDAASKIKDVTEAVDYLHQLGIAHRDIKPQNIVMSHGHAKLCDFGWAAICKQRRKTYCGTFDYVSPQMIQGNTYDQTIDLWSVGVLAYQLLAGKAPFYHSSRRQTVKNILNVEQVQIEYPQNVPSDARQFIQSVLRRKPEQRIKSKDLLKYQFIKRVPILQV